jgi:asparagine synthase (glutamine-hydrolysing)
MCGIVGALTFKNRNFEITEQLIAGMRDTMIHRGPDDAGIYISQDKKVGIGHRRLSIIDLSPSGRQPMCNEDGSIWITYNGEIYNHLELRKELEKKGHFYRSNSDTETIIHLYEEEGVNCLHKLRGMFAFALWDENKKQLFLARDRIGIKPLYYTLQNGYFIFASEIKAILEYPVVTKDIDITAMYHYLTFSSTPSPMTLFKGVNKLSAGALMVIDERGNTKQEQYWDAIIPEENSNTYPQEYYIERLKELLLESIRLRMMSDVPFGVFLSGGIDSSTNVALMSQLMTRPVDTFSVGIKGDHEHNEFQYARKIAAYFKTNHHEVIINDDDFLDLFHTLAFHQDEPLADPVCVPLYYVSKLARDNGTIVIQVGEGSDELFSGYDSYLLTVNRYHRYWKLYSLLPYLVKRGIYFAGRYILNRDDKKEDYLRRATFDEELFWGGAVAFNELEKQKLFSSNLLEKLNGKNSFEFVKLHYNKFDSEKGKTDFLERMIYLELKHRLPELLLMRVDKMGMANSIECREPYLDHQLVEFAMSLPPSLKIKDGHGKYILKKTVEDTLPKEVIYRKKMGFCGSASNMLTEKILSFSENLLCNELKEMNEFFDMDFIKNLFYLHRQKKVDNSFKLWNLLNFGLWYRRWLK